MTRASSSSKPQLVVPVAGKPAPGRPLAIGRVAACGAALVLGGCALSHRADGDRAYTGLVDA